MVSQGGGSARVLGGAGPGTWDLGPGGSGTGVGWVCAGRLADTKTDYVGYRDMQVRADLLLLLLLLLVGRAAPH